MQAKYPAGWIHFKTADVKCPVRKHHMVNDAISGAEKSFHLLFLVLPTHDLQHLQ